jgi:NAD(P)-dependent dehydrogenase (short-subunit alcohol dehydrogenase family)
MFRLDKKIAIVTGGGSGIGKEIALLFTKQGAIVYLLDIDESSSQQVVQQIEQQAGNGHFLKCNVADLATVEQTIDQIIEQEGQIDILVNNAAIAHIGTAETTTPEDMDRLLNINVKSVYYLLHTVIPHMKKSGGVILNMASVAAHVAVKDRFAYSATKGAVYMMTLSVAKDYIAHNIRCNCISPARVHTDLVDGYLEKYYPDNKEEVYDQLSKTQPIGRMGKPEEVAHLALYLCSEEAAFITGCDYPIDGGFLKLNA